MTIRAIQERICAEYGITREAMLSTCKKQPLASIRQKAMAAAREETGASYPKIAREFNRKDHTTVIHACRKMGLGT